MDQEPVEQEIVEQTSVEKTPDKVEGQNIDSQYEEAVKTLLDNEKYANKTNLTILLNRPKLPEEFKKCVIQTKPSTLPALVTCLRMLLLDENVTGRDPIEPNNKNGQNQDDLKKQELLKQQELLKKQELYDQLQKALDTHLTELAKTNAEKQTMLDTAKQLETEKKAKEDALRDKLAEKARNRNTKPTRDVLKQEQQRLEEEKRIADKKIKDTLRDKLAASSEERRKKKEALENASSGGSKKTNRRKSKRKLRGKKKSRRIRRKQ